MIFELNSRVRHFEKSYSSVNLKTKVGIIYYSQKPSLRSGLLAGNNIIFVICAVFTCYLTYYEPIAKKS